MTRAGIEIAPRWKVLLAYAAIYFLWGFTFLAIRIGVGEVPPFTLAAIRFLVAGVALYGWTVARGAPAPSGRQWRAVTLIAVLIFVFDYGLVFWAEQRVPSGLTAVMMGMIPAFMAFSEITLLGTQRLTVRLALALLIGIAGVVVLVSRSLNLGGEPIDPVGGAALVVAALSWSVGSVLSRKLPLPSSRVVSSGAQMLAGGVLLALAAAGLGELRLLDFGAVSRGAWLALLYLIVAGSIVAFTAYVWLIQHQSPTKVGTYAYVNPVVAVLAGHWLGGEALGPRAIVGTGLVLTSVVMITARRAIARA